jgi:murein DD-endopeptidase MepM/ murein hydrolase activator NlpD
MRYPGCVIRYWASTVFAVLTLGVGHSRGFGAPAARGPAIAAEGLDFAGDAVCGAGTFSDDGVCVSWEFNEEGILALTEASRSHIENSGQRKTYDQIGKQPDRPENYDLYVYPVPPGLPGGQYVISGYDLDRPDPLQRRGRGLTHVGHGGVDVPGKRGTPIRLVRLEGQQGEASLLYSGPLFGLSVVTLHTVLEGAETRQYMVLHGHLDGAAPLALGSPLADGVVLGAMGDSGSPNLVHLHLEIRRFRAGVAPEQVLKTSGAYALVQDHQSVVCDPRNLLPLRP